MPRTSTASGGPPTRRACRSAATAVRSRRASHRPLPQRRNRRGWQTGGRRRSRCRRARCRPSSRSRNARTASSGLAVADRRVVVALARVHGGGGEEPLRPGDDLEGGPVRIRDAVVPYDACRADRQDPVDGLTVRGCGPGAPLHDPTVERGVDVGVRRGKRGVALVSRARVAPMQALPARGVGWVGAVRAELRDDCVVGDANVTAWVEALQRVCRESTACCSRGMRWSSR